MASHSDHNNVHSKEQWVNHQRGRIFARLWSLTQGDETFDAAPIIMFHDSLGCVELWHNFPKALCARTGHPVIAYDRLGFGKSDPRDDTLGLDFIADEARTFFPVIREQLGFDRFILFGHSVGGGMAVNCAAELGEHCEALITEAAQTFPEDRTLEGIRVAKEQFKEDGQIERLERYHGDKARWVLTSWTESWLHPEFAAWSLDTVLPRVSCPVLAIHGIYDEYGTTLHPETIVNLSGGTARLAIMPDTYHVPHREREGEVVDMVADFLKSLG